MSWEETYRREYPCKCGKGTYIEIGESDDWRRDREYIINTCPECAEKARILEEKKEKKEAEKVERLKRLTEDINSYFEKHYMEDWLHYFSPAKSKQTVWELATKTGVESYSLTSFYQHTKGSSTEKYVRRLAKVFNMQSIMDALHIDDSHLRSKVEEAMGLRQTIEGPILISY